MNLPLFASTFAVTFVAELPDKTAFASVLMAARRSPLPVFAGAALAFVIQTVVAVCFGSLLGLLPARLVHVFAGLLFLGLAAAMWRRRDAPGEDELKGRAAPPGFWSDAFASFVVIFVAEWGDLTQFSTAALAAKTRAPGTVFAAALSALWVVTALAVLLGSRAKAWLEPAKLKRIAAAAFVLVGAVLLAGFF